MSRTILSLFVLSLVGCTGDLVDIGKKTGNTTPGVDMASSSPGSNPGNNNPGNNNPGTGTGGKDGGASTGGALTFATSIQPGLDSKGCTGGGCHGGTQPPKFIANATGADLTANYGSFKGVASSGEQSPALQTPLQGQGHPKLFNDSTDSVYQQWLAWINAGDPQ
jgi:hypothetical protein